MYTARIILAVGVLALAACASHDKDVLPTTSVSASERLDIARNGFGDAVAAPFHDVGLDKPVAPKLLSDIRYPFETDGLRACVQVSGEIDALDALLGKETYAAALKKDLATRGADAAQSAMNSAAMSATTDLIPFRSWVRKASGAEKAARAQTHAMEMGRLRRAFLRGYGAALSCPDLLPPRPEIREAQAR